LLLQVVSTNAPCIRSIHAFFRGNEHDFAAAAVAFAYSIAITVVVVIIAIIMVAGAIIIDNLDKVFISEVFLLT
jgi:hypothetical protein